MEDNKKNGIDDIKIGIVIPTLGNRKIFVDFLFKRLKKQTRKADYIALVDHKNTTGKIDLKERYVKGINDCIIKGCEFILFIEDDDYYPLTYIEEMAKAWVLKGKPALIGVRQTTYYHIHSNRFVNMMPNHSSAYCSGISNRAIYDTGSNDSPYYDIAIWKANKGVQVDINHPPLGIKHGIGVCGGVGHDPNNSIYQKNIDKGYFLLKQRVDDEAYKFYQSLAGPDTTAIIVNYETPEFTKKAVDSLTKCERTKIIVVDNSRDFKKYEDERVTIIRPTTNLFHGKGLHAGIQYSNTEYIIVMDSDAVVKDHSIVNEAKRILEDNIYAVGCFIEHVKQDSFYKYEFDYLQPYFAVMKKSVYEKFSPFVHHGAPWCQSMIDIYGKMRVKAIMPEAVIHKGESTIKITNKDWLKNWHTPKTPIINMEEKFTLKRGIMGLHFGTSDHRRITPQNISNELAIEYLKKNPSGIKYFDKVPHWYLNKNTPEVKKERNITMMCFVYNERDYLPHVVNFWKKQNINIYVIDNYSNDGTWEYLQKENIPSHRFDTKNMFELGWLQQELVRTIHRIKPDWIIYGAADLYYAFDADIKDVIERAETEGYNQIRTHCWFTCPTDAKKRKLPLIENYPYCETFSDINMISKYDPGIKFAGDHIAIPNARAMFVDGMIINTGNCKPIEIQEEKLKRRQKAWDNGMHKGWGVHYKTQKEKNWLHDVNELYDIRKSPYAKYYFKILDICNQ